MSNNLLKEVMQKLGLNFRLTKELKNANLIIGLKKHLRKNLKLQNLAKRKNIPIYTINQNSIFQIVKLFTLLDFEV